MALGYSILNSYQWNTSPTANISVSYEYQRSGASMQYRFTYRVWLAYSSSYYYNALSLKFLLDGVYSVGATVKGYNNTESGWSYSGTTDWVTVPSKTSGTTSVVITLDDDSKDVQKMRYPSTLYVSGCPSVLSRPNDFDIEGYVALPYTHYITSLTHKLEVKIGNTVVKSVPDVFMPLEVSTYKLFFTEAEKSAIYTLLQTVTESTFTFELTSYDGTTTIGTTSTSATGKVTNAYPSFDDTNLFYYDASSASVAVTHNSSTLVQSRSNVHANIPTATGAKGAIITQYTIEVNGVLMTFAESGDVELGAISVNGDVPAILTVYDSRGYTIKVERILTVVEWNEPIISATIARKNNYEDETKIKVKATFSDVNGANSVSIFYKCAKVGEDYGSAVYIDNNTQYTITCDKTKAYNFEITVTDAFGVPVTKEMLLAKGEFPLFIDTKRSAVGINAFPEKNEALRVGGGIALFEDAIVIKSATDGSSKYFKITVTDDGALNVKEYKS